MEPIKAGATRRTLSEKDRQEMFTSVCVKTVDRGSETWNWKWSQNKPGTLFCSMPNVEMICHAPQKRCYETHSATHSRSSVSISLKFKQTVCKRISYIALLGM